MLAIARDQISLLSALLHSRPLQAVQPVRLLESTCHSKTQNACGLSTIGSRSLCWNARITGVPGDFLNWGVPLISGVASFVCIPELERVHHCLFEKRRRAVFAGHAPRFRGLSSRVWLWFCAWRH